MESSELMPNVPQGPARAHSNTCRRRLLERIRLPVAYDDLFEEVNFTQTDKKTVDFQLQRSVTVSDGVCEGQRGRNLRQGMSIQFQLNCPTPTTDRAGCSQESWNHLSMQWAQATFLFRTVRYGVVRASLQASQQSLLSLRGFEPVTSGLLAPRPEPADLPRATLVPVSCINALAIFVDCMGQLKSSGGSEDRSLK